MAALDLIAPLQENILDWIDGIEKSQLLPIVNKYRQKNKDPNIAVLKPFIPGDFVKSILVERNKEYNDPKGAEKSESVFYIDISRKFRTVIRVEDLVDLLKKCCDDDTPPNKLTDEGLDTSGKAFFALKVVKKKGGNDIPREEWQEAGKSAKILEDIHNYFVNTKKNSDNNIDGGRGDSEQIKIFCHDKSVVDNLKKKVKDKFRKNTKAVYKCFSNEKKK
jgi:hypothetical protein